MKHQLHNLIVIAVILMGLTACHKSVKEQLVGTWYCTDTTTVDGMTYSYEEIDTHKEDGTCSGVVNFIFKGITDVDGENIQIEMEGNMKCSGEWTVNDMEIVTSTTSAEVKLTSMKYYDPSDGSFIAELTESDLTEFETNIFTDEELKEAFSETSTERIITLQENKYVTESDDDGEKTTCTYIRVNQK